MEGDSEQESNLVESARREPQAFARLYETYFPRVYGYIQSRVEDIQSAEDITADVFMTMVQSLHTFEHRQSGSFAGWLFRIAHNLTLNYYRDVGRMREKMEEANLLISNIATPEEELLQKEKSATLRRLIAGLPERRREIITLRFYGELRNFEIAEVLGLDERTVASHLSRGLRDLHALWLAEAERTALEAGAPGETNDV